MWRSSVEGGDTARRMQLSRTMTAEKITLAVDGVTVRGVLYRPMAGAPSPCVVMANGFSGTMDWILPQFAERFVDAGLAVLIFDYRCFGESDGQPRQWVNVKRQREDLRAAIRFARRQPGVDPERIVLWGTSLGGGHVIVVAAEDPRVAAVIAQMPAIDMLSKEARPDPNPVPLRTRLALVRAALGDGLRGLLGFAPHYWKVFGAPGELAIFTDPRLRPNFEALMKGSPSWRNEFTPRFYLGLPRYRAGTMEKLTMPLLVCVATREALMNQKFLESHVRLAPRHEVKRYEGGHFDLYHGLFDEVVADELEFLRRHGIAELRRAVGEPKHSPAA
jgi:pimeloyl-ACP methyl ester carboxylesterase